MVLYQLGPQRDRASEKMANVCHRFEFLQGSLESMAERIRGAALDLLIFPEIGMDARLLPLLGCQLAPRLAVGWGHPVTTGFDHLNAYFSCGMMEPDNADLHYVEPLRLLDGLGVDYNRPLEPDRVEKAALGLDPRKKHVLVPQSLFKLHPDFDSLMAQLAGQRADVEFVLFEAEFRQWQEQYMHRLEASFARHRQSAAQRTRFFGRVSRERYLQINQACDLMLDSLHWSGGNTAIDAFHSGLPVLTCPGRFMRSRQTLAMLQRLGLQDSLACGDPGNLLQRALDLLDRPEETQHLRSEILIHRPALFEAQSARASFLQQVEELLGQPP